MGDGVRWLPVLAAGAVGANAAAWAVGALREPVLAEPVRPGESSALAGVADSPADAEASDVAGFAIDADAAAVVVAADTAWLAGALSEPALPSELATWAVDASAATAWLVGWAAASVAAERTPETSFWVWAMLCSVLPAATAVAAALVATAAVTDDSAWLTAAVPEDKLRRTASTLVGVAVFAVNASAVITWVVEFDCAAGSGTTEGTTEMTLWMWAVIALAAVTVTAEDGVWLPWGKLDGTSWFTPGVPPEPGGGARAEAGCGEPAGCPLPVRLGGLSLSLPSPRGSSGGPAGTGWCDWARWGCWPILLGGSAGGPPPNRPGGSTRTMSAATNVKSRTAVMITTLGTANPAGCTRAAAAADLDMLFAWPIASPARLVISCMM